MSTSSDERIAGEIAAAGAWVSATDRVRWGDVDLAGIVRYDAFARFYDLGEATLLRAAGHPLRETIERAGMLLPRRAFHAEFVAPARLDDALEVRTSVSRLGTTSFTYHHEIRHAAGAPCAVAELTVVCVDRRALGKQPLPSEFVEALRPYLIPRDPAGRDVVTGR
jgi:acyl-CoA thioester hydrolase